MGDVARPQKSLRSFPYEVRFPLGLFHAPVSIVEAVRAEAERRGVGYSDIAREALEVFVATLANGREEIAAIGERALGLRSEGQTRPRSGGRL